MGRLCLGLRGVTTVLRGIGPAYGIKLPISIADRQGRIPTSHDNYSLSVSFDERLSVPVPTVSYTAIIQLPCLQACRATKGLKMDEPCQWAITHFIAFYIWVGVLRHQ
jgi:hypothetical protein